MKGHIMVKLSIIAITLALAVLVTSDYTYQAMLNMVPGWAWPFIAATLTITGLVAIFKFIFDVTK